jgi:hypothetical protein
MDGGEWKNEFEGQVVRRINELEMKGLYFVLLIVSLLFQIEVAEAQILKVEGEMFTYDGKPFDMWGVRVASASQNDEFTRQLINNLNDYKSMGINTISVFLQGSSGGFSDPFLENGKSIEPKFWQRTEQIIKACQTKAMVVIIGVFYQRSMQNPEIRQLESEEDIRNAVITVAEKLKPYNNVILNIANEQNSSFYKSFSAFSFNNPEKIVELCKLVKETDPLRIVGGGGYHDSSNVVIGKSEFVDVLLFDTYSEDINNGHHSGWHYNWFKEQGVTGKPMVNVEIFGGWTSQFTPQGVYSDAGKKIHWKEIEEARKQPGLYVHFHSNPWFQGEAQQLGNRFDLGGDGTTENPGVRWYFEKIKE